MKHGPLNPHLLIEYNQYFIENNANINILDDFFFHLALLIDKDENYFYNENIADIVQDMDFDSLDEANIFIKKYTEFINSITDFIIQLENSEDENDEELISELYYTFLNINNDDIEKIAPIILSNAGEIIHVILDKYNISLTGDDYEVEQFELEIKNKIGEKYSFLFVALLILIERFDMEPEDNEGKLPLLFSLTVIFVVNMDLLRKEEFKIINSLRERTKNTGRNDPCPCGSGLKFKKCCLLKI